MDMVNAVLTAMTKTFFQKVTFFRSMSEQIRRKVIFLKQNLFSLECSDGDDDSFWNTGRKSSGNRPKKIRSITELVEKQKLKSEKVLEVIN